MKVLCYVSSVLIIRHHQMHQIIPKLLKFHVKAKARPEHRMTSAYLRVRSWRGVPITRYHISLSHRLPQEHQLHWYNQHIPQHPIINATEISLPTSIHIQRAQEQAKHKSAGSKGRKPRSTLLTLTPNPSRLSMCKCESLVLCLFGADNMKPNIAWHQNTIWIQTLQKRIPQYI